MRSLRGRLRLLTASLTVAFGVAALLAVSHLRALEGSVSPFFAYLAGEKALSDEPTPEVPDWKALLLR